MVIAFGEVLWDVLPSGEQLGGAVANCAFRLHQLGTPVRLISRLGNDELGVRALSILKDKGLSTELVQIDTHYPSGTVDVKISTEGDADYVINKNVAYDFIEIDDALLDLASSAKAIAFGNLIQRREVSRNSLYALLEAGVNSLKIVDINLRKECFSPETILESIRRTDVLKLNDKEVDVVKDLLKIDQTTFQGFCETLAECYSVSTVLISLGANGVYAFDTKEGHLEISGYPSKVVDTVGAGDSFTAGFIHKKLGGASLHDACDFANLIGSLVTTRRGGMPSISADDINDYRESHMRRSAIA